MVRRYWPGVPGYICGLVPVHLNILSASLEGPPIQKPHLRILFKDTEIYILKRNKRATNSNNEVVVLDRFLESSRFGSGERGRWEKVLIRRPPGHAETKGRPPCDHPEELYRC